MSEGSPTEEFGPYIVYEQLGVGGMAQVHRAVAAHDAFQRSVALKRMLSHIAGSDDMVKSFVREARLASYLRHENVAQTYDLGRVGDTYFIVMELITGRNLREVLRHCGVTTGPMPVQFALNILNQICDALDYAHNLRDETGQPLGIIHRDVSPSNVIVSESGVVKLIDFGIAKASGGGLQTLSGALKGKFAYMAPEYIGGRIDARADLFAVGVIAHELLTNRPLFTGRDDIDTLSRVRDMPIAPPSKKNPQVPPEIDDIVMTALERDPERRWQHATALRTALTTLTRRLGLVASNAQVVQWLDLAFSQPPKRAVIGASDHDTDTDEETADHTSDQPSISIEQETVEHRTLKQRPVERAAVEAPSIQSMSHNVTIVRTDEAPTPPARPPLNATGSTAAQRSSLPASATALRSGPSRKLAAGSAAPTSVPIAAGSAAPTGAPIISATAPPIATRTRPASAPPPALSSPAIALGKPGSPTADPAAAPPARTIPIMSAAPGFPATRARSASAPPPQSFQAALKNLSASSTAPAPVPLAAAPSTAGEPRPAAPPLRPSAASLAHGTAAPTLASPSAARPVAAPVAAARPSPSFNPPSSPASPSNDKGFKPGMGSPSNDRGFKPGMGSPSHGLPSPSPSSAPTVFGVAAPVPASAIPRPSASSIPPPAAHDARPAAAARAPAPPAGPRPTSPILIAFLVVLATAGAAITVYFVLPLLT